MSESKTVYWIEGDIDPETDRLPTVMSGVLTGKKGFGNCVEVSPVPGTPRMAYKTFDSYADAEDEKAKRLRRCAAKLNAAAKRAEGAARKARG